MTPQLASAACSGDCLQDFTDGPETIVLSGGSFIMGSPAAEAGRTRDGREDPQISVTINRPFAIGRFPVTVSQFAVFSAETGYQQAGGIVWRSAYGWELDPTRSFRQPGFAQTDRHPAVGISWIDAQAYVTWLRERTGREYRLPTEAEWEYAARAGTRSAFWWGESITPDLGNYDASHSLAGSPIGHSPKATIPVDHYAPNAWGLYQVHGNVWEWCADDFSPSLQGLPRDGSPFVGSDCGPKVLRGGSWLNGPWNLRSACRLADPRDFRHVSFGFRVVCLI